MISFLPPARASAALSLLFAFAAAAAAPDVRTQVGTFKATKTGVDAAGGFWAWNSVAQSVTRIASDGKPRSREDLPQATSVDVDEARGIIVLLPDAQSVQIADWIGGVGRTIKLRHAVTDVAWLSGDEIAVSPRFGSFRVEVWNARTGVFVRSLGPSSPHAEPQTGATAARATLLRYRANDRELVAFDAFYGDLTVYSASGAVVRTAHVQHPDRPRLDAWIAEQAAASSQPFTPLILAFAKLTVDAQGTVWLAERADEKRGTVDVVKIAPQKAPQRTTIAAPDCASIRFESWRGNFIFYRDPKSPLPECVGVRRQS